MLSASELKRLLRYEPNTGDFYWLADTGKRRFTGKKAGSLGLRGYICICIKYRHYPAHRLAWFYMTGKWPSHDIDHRNRIRTDNRFCNLREATREDNIRNAQLSAANKSGFKGVSFCRSTKRWRVNFCHRFLGRYDTKVEAALAYDAEAKARFGEFAYLNFPEA